MVNVKVRLIEVQAGAVAVRDALSVFWQFWASRASLLLVRIKVPLQSCVGLRLVIAGCGL